MSKTEWKECTLGSVCDLVAGYAFKSADFGDFNSKVIKITHITPPRVDEASLAGVDISKYDASKLGKYVVQSGDYVFAMTGATIGKIGRLYKGEAYINQRVLTFRNKESIINKDFLYYVLLKDDFAKYVYNHIDSESAQPNISANTVAKYTFDLPPIEKQKEIAKILSSLDDKIELNNAINRNLEEQAQAIFKSWFIDFEPFGGKMPTDWKTMQAQEYFSISIGKTPPRKEQELFSDVNTDDNVKWVSISDMGSCGMYISDSSEYLTKEAITNYNVCIIPDNTVILSFKLTVGRIAITDGEMTSNEAIAHFCSEDKTINEYLYCYLKNFSFETMGSTSSIATAVNSKIIKAMPFILPNKETVDRFHKITKPLFDTIKSNQQETKKLNSIRDGLLPKLMSGEMKLSC
jgi:type I restriction enzyme S subunit